MERPAGQPLKPVGADPGVAAGPPPRAFAQGTGVLLQTAGMLMLLSSCVVCAFTGQFDPVESHGEAIDSIRQHQLLEHPLSQLFRAPAKNGAQTGYMLTVMFTTVGGMAMAGFGLGLQSERRRAGWGALATTAGLSIILIVAGAELWIGHASIVARLWHLCMLIIVLLLTGFSWAALRQVLADPPRADIDVVPPGTKIPYNFYHDDPPEVRLAQELAGRRVRLEKERAEIERLEGELRDKESKK